jgi:hypothetical protein
MTNPTSNFGWQMPEATDLVTNLPADFEVFGQAVDTDFADLLGGTTGQVLSKTSGTDLDFTWVTDANGMANPMTTTGDIIYSSPNSTPVRLGIGSAANVLTVAGGVPTWAAPAASGGGMTLISSTALTGSSISLTSIPSSYYNLEIVMRNYLPSGNQTPFVMTLNNDTNSNRYKLVLQYANVDSSNQAFAAARWDIDQQPQENGATSQNIAQYTIPDYANTTTWKMIYGMGYANYGASNFNQSTFRSIYNQTAAISSIQIAPQTGTFTSGTVLLYGVK